MIIAARLIRTRAAAAAGLAGACLAAGCTSSPAPGTGPWPARSAAGTITVTILSGVDTSVSPGSAPVDGAAGMYAELVNWWNRYETPVTRIHVALKTVPGGATAAHSEMLADAEAAEPGYDIYNLDNEWVPEFAAAGHIRSLQGRLTGAGFLPQPLASGSYDGRLYAAPFTTDVGLLYYRTDLVPAAEVATVTSFGGLVRLANDTMHRSAALTTGYAGQFASYEGLTVNLLELIHGDSPDAFAPDGTIADTNAVTEGLTQVSGAMDAGVIPAGELGYTEQQAVTAFSGGGALFMRNWPIYYQQLATAKGKAAGQVAGHFAVTPLPYPSVLGGQDLAVAAASPHPSAALQVIRYLTSPQAERCLFAVAGFPATRAAAYTDDGSLPAAYGDVTGRPMCGTAAGPSVKIGQTILAAISRAFLRPRTPYYTEFSSIIQAQVPALLRQDIGASAMSDLVTRLAAELNAAAAGHPPAP